MTRVTEEVFLNPNHICIIGKYLLLITSEQIKFTYKAIAFRTYIPFSMTNPNLSAYYIYNALFYLCKIMNSKERKSLCQSVPPGV